MTSPLRLLALAALALAALATTTAPAAAAPKKTCKPKASNTVRNGARVRIFTRENEHRGWVKLYACHRRTKRTVTIATRHPDNEAYPHVTWDTHLARVRGNFAAIAVTREYENDQTDAYGVVADPTHGRVRGRAAVTGERSELTDLELHPRGHIAFMTRWSPIDNPQQVSRRIDVLPRNGGPELIVSHPDLVDGSLSLVGDDLSWLQGNVRNGTRIVPFS